MSIHKLLSFSDRSVSNWVVANWEDFSNAGQEDAQIIIKEEKSEISKSIMNKMSPCKVSKGLNSQGHLVKTIMNNVQIFEKTNIEWSKIWNAHNVE